MSKITTITKIEKINDTMMLAHCSDGKVYRTEYDIGKQAESEDECSNCKAIGTNMCVQRLPDSGKDCNAPQFPPFIWVEADPLYVALLKVKEAGDGPRKEDKKE